MPRILEAFRDADGIPVQAYFAAFMIEHGIDRLTAPQPERASRNADFMAWLDDRWRELERRHGFNRAERTQQQAAMHEYLETRAVDHMARNKVEAA